MQRTEAAERVVLAFEAAGDREEWVADALAAGPFVGYLRRTRSGPVAPGEQWEEFVSRGCGTTLDVTLTVERVDGGHTVGPETAFAFRPAHE